MPRSITPVHAVRLIHHRKPLTAVTMTDPRPAPGEIVVDVRAAGICHSDAHYRSDSGRTSTPLTLGHEIAGVVSAKADGVDSVDVGSRVALHYLISCGSCAQCRRYGEQFCSTGAMLGKDRDGGFAERVVAPAINAVPIPDEVSFAEAAVMMCSTATAYHALRLSALQPHDSVGIIGFGGLGASAVQLAGILGVREIYAVDRVREKLAAAESSGAVAIDASGGGFRDALMAATAGRGIDVALDFTGSATACINALRSLAPGGRLMLVAIDIRSLTIDGYADVLGRERRIVGCSDHTRAELFDLMGMAQRGELDLDRVITRSVPLEAGAINQVLDDLDHGTTELRTVIDVGAA